MVSTSVQLNQSIRRDIVSQILSIYYPDDIAMQTINQVATMWNEYLDDNIGKLPSNMKGTLDVSIYIEGMPNTSFSFTSFTGRFASLPFLEWKYDNRFVLDLNKCPISSIRLACQSLDKFMQDKDELETALWSELLKHGRLNPVLNDFPELKGPLSRYLDETVIDLPVEVEIDMEDISIEDIAV